MSERKRGSEYLRGYEDACYGASPDYSQARAEDFRDYCAGYRDGLWDARNGAIETERVDDERPTP